eukprot:363740-Chlamydomonas_euryale.AAC.36
MNAAKVIRTMQSCSNELGSCEALTTVVHSGKKRHGLRDGTARHVRGFYVSLALSQQQHWLLGGFVEASFLLLRIGVEVCSARQPGGLCLVWLAR